MTLPATGKLEIEMDAQFSVDVMWLWTNRSIAQFVLSFHVNTFSLTLMLHECQHNGNGAHGAAAKQIFTHVAGPVQ